MEKLYVLGHPIAHSKSPVMYNVLYPRAGLDWEYGSADLETEGEARAFIEAADFLSINITTPYKPLALELAARADLAARLAGGANVLVKEGATGGAGEGATSADSASSTSQPSACLYAYNVDGLGCVNYLRREGVEFMGAHVVVCGTGPTSLSIMHAAVQAGANVTLLGRSSERARAAAARYDALLAESSAPADATAVASAASALADATAVDALDAASAAATAAAITAGSYEEGEDAIRAASIILDATSLGMHEGDPAPFNTELLNANQVVFDTVYGHGETALIGAARACGAKALDGSGMLVAQAVATAQIVTQTAGAKLSMSFDEAFEVMAAAAGFKL